MKVHKVVKEYSRPQYFINTIYNLFNKTFCRNMIIEYSSDQEEPVPPSLNMTILKKQRELAKRISKILMLGDHTA